MSTKIEGRTTDGRYTKPVDKVDKGSMSSNRVPLPVKKNFKPTPLPEDPITTSHHEEPESISLLLLRRGR